MKLIDLLLFAAAAAIVAAGWLIHPSLGLTAASVASVALWWAMGDDQ